MKKHDHRITREFRLRQTRQIIAVAIALFLVLLFAVMYKRPDIFGMFSAGTLGAVQIILIAAFIGFTVVNWRCPSCGKHLGSDINRNVCKKCGIRLQ